MIDIMRLQVDKVPSYSYRVIQAIPPDAADSSAFAALTLAVIESRVSRYWRIILSLSIFKLPLLIFVRLISYVNPENVVESELLILVRLERFLMN